MAKSAGLLNMTVKEVRGLIKSRQISPNDVCEACLKRVRATDELNSYITITPPTNYEATSQIPDDSRILNGIPIAIKDNFSTKDILTTCASNTLKSYIPAYTATIVERMLHQGAVIMGKTNMDEFAMGSANIDSIHGPARNPWRYQWSNTSTKHTKQSKHPESANHIQDCNKDTTDFHVPGGSSGGSAVAVATGSVFAALGSDTAGSVRIPAAWCGVTAIKPSYGLLSRHGLISLVNSLDVPGIMGKTVEDVAQVLNAVAGWDVKDSTTVTDEFTPIDLSADCDVTKLHFGLPKEFDNTTLSNDVSTSWRDVADMLENNGAKVSWINLPHCVHAMTCYHILGCCEVASNFARYDGLQYGHRATNCHSTEELYSKSRHHSFNDIVRGRILAGNYFLLADNYEKYFVRAQKVWRLISNDLRDVFTGGVDMLLTPTVPYDAPLYSDYIKVDQRVRGSDVDAFSAIANFAGVPAITIPCGLSTNQLPLAIQLISPAFTEQKLLSTAKFIENAVDFQRLNLDFLESWT